MFQEVRGEIFEVDDKMLLYLDNLEEHPTVYQRVEVNTIVETGRSSIHYIYSVTTSTPAFTTPALKGKVVTAGWRRQGE